MKEDAAPGCWAGVALVVVAVALPNAGIPAAAVGEELAEVRFCDVVWRLQSGESQAVLVRGALWGGGSILFFDPDNLTCGRPTQAFSRVSLASGYKGTERLNGFLESPGRKWSVLIRGRLQGPGSLGPDDPTVPWAANVMFRTKERRDGIPTRTRTSLVIEEVLEAEPAERDMPTPNIWEPPPTRGLPPHPVAIAPPEYPELLRSMELAGTVVLKLTVEAGQVKAVEALSGDSLLVHEAKASATQWRFAEKASAKFEVTFVYELEDRPGAVDEPARVEMRLPTYVRVTASRYDW